MASTMSSRYFRFVVDFLASMITENPRFRLSFLDKTKNTLSSRTCTRYLIPKPFTPFVLLVKLPVNWPKFTDRTVNKLHQIKCTFHRQTLSSWENSKCFYKTVTTVVNWSTQKSWDYQTKCSEKRKLISKPPYETTALKIQLNCKRQIGEFLLQDVLVVKLNTEQ